VSPFLALPGLLLASAGHSHFDFKSWNAGEWFLFGTSALVTIWVLWLAVRATVSPGEEAPDHVKRSILDDDVPSLSAPSLTVSTHTVSTRTPARP